MWFGFWGCFQVHCDWAYWALASTTVKGRVWRSLRKRPFSPGCIIPSESMFGSLRTSLPRSSALLVNPAPDSLTQVWKTRCSACRHLQTSPRGLGELSWGGGPGRRAPSTAASWASLSPFIQQGGWSSLSPLQLGLWGTPSKHSPPVAHCYSAPVYAS